MSGDDLRQYREEAHASLAVVEHYCRLARGHLELADDVVGDDEW